MAEDISPDIIKKTQKILGKHVKKPALTDKLLKKPPFRFLHDIVISVIKETGFLKGLFSSEELISENVKEKEAKLVFLNKLIDAIKTVTKTDVTVRASKIVAGLEPTKTNLLLQAIGKAIDEKKDVSEYIAQLNSGQADTTEKKKKKTTVKRDDKEKTSKSKIKEDSTTKTIKTKKINESPRSKTKTSTPKDSSRDRKLDKTTKVDTVKKINIIEEEKGNDVSKAVIVEGASSKETTSVNDIAKIENIVDKDNNEGKGSDDKIKLHQENVVELNKAEEHFSKAGNTANVDISNKEQEDTNRENLDNREVKSDTHTSIVRPKSARPKNENGSISLGKQKIANTDQDEILKPVQITGNQPKRPKSSLRPPSVRPSSARPGAPRLRPDSALPLQETVTMGNINVIVENVDNMDDEETVVIQTTSEVAEENFNAIEVPKDNKGQLVEQILEQIQEEGEGLKKKVDIDWEQDALHNKDGAAKEVGQLRSLIQTLTRTANPLGKLMNYLHEDIDAMHGELQMWTNVKNQLFKEINKQKRLSVESNKPLLGQLEHLQEEIKKQQQEIVVSRSNILRNESRIKELLNI